MTKLMTAAAAAAILAASSFSAFAAEATGSITSIDAAAGTIVLDDGKTYQVTVAAESSGTQSGNKSGVATPPELASFKPGDKVKITFEDQDGKLMASAVAPATM